MKTFLSSTYIDLVNQRKAAVDAIERLGQQVGRMEVFGARPAEASAACVAEIDECDVFVGIYAHRYGFIPNGSEVSITETEFEYAKAKGKFQLCFVVDENHPWPPKLIEEEPGKSKLAKFKENIGRSVVRDTFTTCEDLAFKIAASLGRHLSASHDKSTYTEFFEKIVSELACLRKEVREQKDLLARVNHVSSLLPKLNEDSKPIQPMHKTLPLDLEGCWRDSKSPSTLYARFLDDDLIVPYSYGDDSKLTGVFFDFQQGSENVVFSRFKWVESPIQGFAYIEWSAGAEYISGGWWYSEDVPIQAVKALQQNYLHLPRMNELRLSRLPQSWVTPSWVNAFFSIPKAERLNQLRRSL